MDAPAITLGSVNVEAADPAALASFWAVVTGATPAPSGDVVYLPEVDRLVSAGARWRWDVLDEHPHVQWTTMADPEGNLFCLAEHPPGH